jgi:hypothetical protein
LQLPQKLICATLFESNQEVLLSQRWFFNHKGQIEGPHSTEEIARRILGGLLGPDDLVFLEGEKKWTPLNEFPVFLEALADRPTQKKKVQGIGKLEPVQVDQRPWVVLVKGREGKRVQQGPLSGAEVQSLLREKKLSPSDYIWRKGMKQWYRIYALGAQLETVAEPTSPSEILEVVHAPAPEVLIEALPPEAAGPDLVVEKKDPRDEPPAAMQESATQQKPPPRVGPKKKQQRARKAWSGLGLVVGALLVAVAGVSVYLYRQQVVPTVAVKVTPSPIAPPPMAPATPEPRPERPKPEPVKKAPTYVRFSKKPGGLLEVETDGSEHYEAVLDFKSRPGQIVGSQSYARTLQKKTVELETLNWPTGTYNVKVRIGEVSESDQVFVGKRLSSFKADLDAYNKGLVLTWMNERVALIRSLKSMVDLAEALSAHLRQGQASSWSVDHKNWRKKWSRALDGRGQKVKGRGKNDVILAEVWLEAREVQRKVERIATIADRQPAGRRSEYQKDVLENLAALKKSLSGAQAFSIWK